MINEARSLLLNIPANQVDLSLPWSAYVPAEYTAITLPPWLAAVRNLLLGSNPTQSQLNQRVYQYMQLLHTGQFADHIFALDGRITYLPFNNTGLAAAPLPSPTNVGNSLTQLKSTVYSDHPIFSPAVEPYITYSNLWNKHPLGAYQLTGLLLAVIYSTRDIRNNVWTGANQ